METLDFLYTVAVAILTIEMFVILLVLVALVFGMNYGTRYLNINIKLWMPQLRGYLTQAQDISNKVAVKMVNPPIQFRSRLVGVRQSLAALVGRGPKD